MTKSNCLEETQKRRGRPRAFDRECVLECSLEIFGKYGYEAASVSQLCAVMGLNPPSLYAAFGNKANLFEEAITYYKNKYWAVVWQELENEVNVFKAFDTFYCQSAKLLSRPESSRGCLVVQAAANISEESPQILSLIRKLNQSSINSFQQRITTAIEQGQLAPTTDALGLAFMFKTISDGMAIQSRDGASVAQLQFVVPQVLAILRSHAA